MRIKEEFEIESNNKTALHYTHLSLGLMQTK